MARAFAISCASFAAIALLACGSAVFSGGEEDGGSDAGSGDSTAADGNDDGRAIGLDAPDPGDGDVGKSIVFMTQETVPGDFGGTVSADSLCNGAAFGKLPGTYHAYVGVDPSYDGSLNIVGSGPWYLPDLTTLIFADRAALAAVPSNVIDQNEKGQTISHLVWTGTSKALTLDCTDWSTASSGATGEYGDPSNPATWKTAGSQACNTPLSLLCFQE